MHGLEVAHSSKLLEMPNPRAPSEACSRLGRVARTSCSATATVTAPDWSVAVSSDGANGGSQVPVSSPAVNRIRNMRHLLLPCSALKARPISAKVPYELKTLNAQPAALPPKC